MDKPKNLSIIPDQKTIDAEAADWLVRLEEDHVPAEDRAAFLVWRNASARHRDAFDRLALVWGDFEEAKVLADYAASDENADLLARDSERARFGGFGRRSALIGIAASAAALLAAAGMLVELKGGRAPAALGEAIFAEAPAPAEDLAGRTGFETAVGEQEIVELPDGSVIELNTNSRVEYAYRDDAREIELVRGEAFFKVAPDKTRPFTVATPGGRVKAVGTAFVVRLDRDKVDVLVSEGEVVFLAQQRLTVAGRKHAPAEDEATPVSAGQTAIFHKSAERVDAIEPEALARKLSWRQGVLAFSNEPLSGVVADINRYTDIVIEIDDATLRDLPVSGYFKIGEVNEMFEALELMAGLQAEPIGEKKVRLVKSPEGG